MVAVIAAIVFIERGQRRIPVQYARRSSAGKQVSGGQNSHIPLKVNTAGVIPPIFASSLMMIPAQIPMLFPDSSDSYGMILFNSLMGYGTYGYFTFYVGLIIFFAFFYTAVVFNPVDVAENMKKYGGSIPGIRPGKDTSDYIYKVLNRVTFGGAIYLALVCVVPDFLKIQLNVPFYFGGTSLLIVVGVALDTVSQIETHLITRHYEGFMKGVRLKGRRG
jgi:preprotein translocase subunit SecY